MPHIIYNLSYKKEKIMKKFFDIALAQAQAGINLKEGGPFGAVVILDEIIVGQGHNTVLRDNDPTAHAEINAIRDSCRYLNRYNLKGALLITTCEPCPMCLGAIMWAHVSSVIYGCNSHDAALVGFDDECFYEQLKAGRSSSLLRQASPEIVNQCRDLMNSWANQPHIIY